MLAVLTAGLAAGTGFTAGAQNSLKDVLRAVEMNSPRLAVAAGQLELDRLESASQRLLASPEVEFNYLWGQNAEVGNRKDLRITQSFDFATLSGMKGKLASGMDELAGLNYKAEKMEVFAEAKSLCADLAYTNALISALSGYLADIEKLNEATEQKMNAGEATVFESGKAKVQLASVKARLAKAQVERTALMSELRALAGTDSIDYTAEVYELTPMPSDFGSWYAEAEQNSPVLQYVAKELDVARTQVRIEKSAWAPELNLGYMSELGLTDKYRGLTVGVSIPLWSNRNKVRSANAAASVAATQKLQQEKLFLTQLTGLWSQADALREAAGESRDVLSRTDSRALMLDAVRKGEISMLDYIVDLSGYYDALEETLDIERDYAKAVILLEKYSSCE